MNFFITTPQNSTTFLGFNISDITFNTVIRLKLFQKLDTNNQKEPAALSPKYSLQISALS